MMSIRRRVGPLIIAVVGACSDSGPHSNPSPSLASATPDRTTVGSHGIGVTLNGAAFTRDSRVTWNGASRPTTWLDGSRLFTTLNDVDLASAMVAKLAVVNPAPGGGTSGEIEFTVGYPTPTISSLAPTSAFIDDSGVSLTVDGTGFAGVSTIQWNGQPLVTTFDGPNRLRGEATGSLLLQPGNIAITVTNPAPGGGTSAPAVLGLLVPKPTLASISPDAVTIGSAFTLAATGTHFVSGAQLYWNDVPRSTTVLSATSLRSEVGASEIASPGTVTVRVVNPGSGGASAETATLRVRGVLPQIASLVPNTASVASAAFTLTVNGTNFSPGMVVLWNGQPRPTSFQSTTLMTAAIPSTDLAAIGNVQVTVSNTATGDASTPMAFTVALPPAPQLSSMIPSSAFAGTLGLTLNVTGVNFLPGMVVLWSGQDRQTSYVNATTLTATVTTQDLSTAGVGVVSVRNPATAQTSGSSSFVINPQLPMQISSIAPTVMVAGSASFPLVVTGGAFFPGMVVRWNGQARQTTYVSSTTLTANISTSDLSSPITATLAVADPPTGRVSNSVNFRVPAPAPAPVFPIPLNLWDAPPGATSWLGPVYLESEAGDPVGAGQTYKPNPYGFAFYSTTPAHLSFYQNGVWWADFQAMAGQTRFQKGYYPDAMRYGLSIPAASTMGVFHQVVACNLVTGWFAIDSVAYDTTGFISALRLRFEQHCDGIAPALHGVIGYHVP
jgi:hypothetical protein